SKEGEGKGKGNLKDVVAVVV
ncbi:hypothetical protein Tco_0021004, partial [Tanacetum coccineum]